MDGATDGKGTWMIILKEDHQVKGEGSCTRDGQTSTRGSPLSGGSGDDYDSSSGGSSDDGSDSD